MYYQRKVFIIGGSKCITIPNSVLVGSTVSIAGDSSTLIADTSGK